MLLFRRRWPCCSKLRAFYSCYADSATPISISAPSDAKEYLPTRLKAKCSYVKALYGIDPDCTVAQLCETQAASLALQSYLHLQRGMAMDDAIFMGEHFGVHRTNLSKVVYECPKAFDINLVEKLKPVVERLEQLQVQKEAIGEILTHAPGKFEKLYKIGDALHALELLWPVLVRWGR